MTTSRSDLTLPGDIEGLLRRGSPVVPKAGRYAGEPAVVVCAYDDGTVDLGIDDIAAAQVERYEAAEVALDLTDPTGRAHAAWWLWGRTEAGADVDVAVMSVMGSWVDTSAWLDEMTSGADDTDDDSIGALRRVVLHVAGRTP